MFHFRSITGKEHEKRMLLQDEKSWNVRKIYSIIAKRDSQYCCHRYHRDRWHQVHKFPNGFGSSFAPISEAHYCFGDKQYGAYSKNLALSHNWLCSPFSGLQWMAQQFHRFSSSQETQSHTSPGSAVSPICFMTLHILLWSESNFGFSASFIGHCTYVSFHFTISDDPIFYLAPCLISWYPSPRVVQFYLYLVVCFTFGIILFYIYVCMYLSLFCVWFLHSI